MNRKELEQMIRDHAKLIREYESKSKEMIGLMKDRNKQFREHLREIR